MLSVYHMTAFTIGFVMDLLFGDPYWLPHPIRWIGRLIGWLDRKLLGETDGAVRNEAAEKKKGRWLVAFVLLPVLFLRQQSCLRRTGSIRRRGLLQRVS